MLWFSEQGSVFLSSPVLYSDIVVIDIASLACVLTLKLVDFTRKC